MIMLCPANRGKVPFFFYKYGMSHFWPGNYFCLCIYHNHNSGTYSVKCFFASLGCFPAIVPLILTAASVFFSNVPGILLSPVSGTRRSCVVAALAVFTAAVSCDICCLMA